MEESIWQDLDISNSLHPPFFKTNPICFALYTHPRTAGFEIETCQKTSLATVKKNSSIGDQWQHHTRARHISTFLLVLKPISWEDECVCVCGNGRRLNNFDFWFMFVADGYKGKNLEKWLNWGVRSWGRVYGDNVCRRRQIFMGG